MATSYNKLWKLLVDKKMSKADLRKASGVSPNTMTKLRRDEPVMRMDRMVLMLSHIGEMYQKVQNLSCDFIP